MFEIGDIININPDGEPVIMKITGIKHFPERKLYQMVPLTEFPFSAAAYFERELINFKARKHAHNPKTC